MGTKFQEGLAKLTVVAFSLSPHAVSLLHKILATTHFRNFSKWGEDVSPFNFRKFVGCQFSKEKLSLYVFVFVENDEGFSSFHFGWPVGKNIKAGGFKNDKRKISLTKLVFGRLLAVNRMVKTLYLMTLLQCCTIGIDRA